MNDFQQVERAIRSIPWLNQLEDLSLESLRKISRIIQLGSDEILFHEGDKEEYLYVLLEGRIAIEMNVPNRGNTLVYTVEPFDIIGWSSVTPVIRQMTATAKTLSPSTLLALDAIKLRQLCDEDNKIGYTFMLRLANTIAMRLLVTRFQLVELLSKLPQPE